MAKNDQGKGILWSATYDQKDPSKIVSYELLGYLFFNESGFPLFVNLKGKTPPFNRLAGFSATDVAAQFLNWIASSITNVDKMEFNYIRPFVKFYSDDIKKSPQRLNFGEIGLTTLEKIRLRSIIDYFSEQKGLTPLRTVSVYIDEAGIRGINEQVKSILPFLQVSKSQNHFSNIGQIIAALITNLRPPNSLAGESQRIILYILYAAFTNNNTYYYEKTREYLISGGKFADLPILLVDLLAENTGRYIIHKDFWDKVFAKYNQTYLPKVNEILGEKAFRFRSLNPSHIVWILQPEVKQAVGYILNIFPALNDKSPYIGLLIEHSLFPEGISKDKVESLEQLVALATSLHEEIHAQVIQYYKNIRFFPPFALVTKTNEELTERLTRYLQTKIEPKDLIEQWYSSFKQAYNKEIFFGNSVIRHLGISDAWITFAINQDPVGYIKLIDQKIKTLPRLEYENFIKGLYEDVRISRTQKDLLLKKRASSILDIREMSNVWIDNIFFGNVDTDNPITENFATLQQAFFQGKKYFPIPNVPVGSEAEKKAYESVEEFNNAVLASHENIEESQPYSLLQEKSYLPKIYYSQLPVGQNILKFKRQNLYSNPLLPWATMIVRAPFELFHRLFPNSPIITNLRNAAVGIDDYVQRKDSIEANKFARVMVKPLKELPRRFLNFIIPKSWQLQLLNVIGFNIGNIITTPISGNDNERARKIIADHLREIETVGLMSNAIATENYWRDVFARAGHPELYEIGLADLQKALQVALEPYFQGQPLSAGEFAQRALATLEKASINQTQSISLPETDTEAARLTAFFQTEWTNFIIAVQNKNPNITSIGQKLVQTASTINSSLAQMMVELVNSRDKLDNSAEAKKVLNDWIVFVEQYLLPRNFYGSLSIISDLNNGQHYYFPVIYKIERREKRAFLDNKQFDVIYGRKIDKVNTRGFIAHSTKGENVVFIDLNAVDQEILKIRGTLNGQPYELFTGYGMSAPSIDKLIRQSFSGILDVNIRASFEYDLEVHELTHKVQELFRISNPTYRPLNNFGVPNDLWSFMDERSRQAIEDEVGAYLAQLAKSNQPVHVLTFLLQVFFDPQATPHNFAARYILNQLGNQPVGRWVEGWERDRAILLFNQLTSSSGIKQQAEQLYRQLFPNMMLVEPRKNDEQTKSENLYSNPILPWATMVVRAPFELLARIFPNSQSLTNLKNAAVGVDDYVQGKETLEARRFAATKNPAFAGLVHLTDLLNEWIDTLKRTITQFYSVVKLTN